MLLFVPVVIAQEGTPTNQVRLDQPHDSKPGITVTITSSENLFDRGIAFKVSLDCPNPRIFETARIKISVPDGTEHKLRLLVESELDLTKPVQEFISRFKDKSEYPPSSDFKIEISKLEFSGFLNEPPAVRKLIEKRLIRIGFTARQLVLSWGKPESINRTITASGKHEQWVYGDGQYVYLTNGTVTSMQQTTH